MAIAPVFFPDQPSKLSPAPSFPPLPLLLLVCCHAINNSEPNIHHYVYVCMVWENGEGGGNGVEGGEMRDNINVFVF